MKKINLALFSLALIFLSGCITIIEKYTINADGSGSMEYLIDMSELYGMMSAMSDSSNEVNTDDLDKTMREALPGLQEISGISNIRLSGDITKYIAGIRFDFANGIALNKAMAVLLEGESTASENFSYVDIKRKTFTRYSLTSEDLNKEAILGNEDVDPETLKMILESMKYKIIVDFDKKVKKVSTLADYTIEKDTVRIETNFSEIFDNPETLKTVIKTR
ncbi:MAG: hypothetical protein H6540_03705 [Bacteroidales bacterium]|nr:hypothetical protein [Bacteroidales bacterium]